MPSCEASLSEHSAKLVRVDHALAAEAVERVIADLRNAPPVAAPGELTLTVVCGITGLAQLRRDYEQLHALTGNTLPFALHDWHLAWCQHLLNLEPAIEERLKVYVVHNASHVCVAIIPLIFARRRVGVFNISSIGLLGADPAITEIRSPSVAPGYEERVAAILHGGLKPAPEWNWIQWIGKEHDVFSAAVGRLRSLHWQPMSPGYILDLRATWVEFHAHLKRNIRESLRHCYNSLKRDGYRFEFRVVSDAAEIPAALDRLFELHAMRAKMVGAVHHPNRFASSVSRRFVADVCARLAVRGITRIFQLRIGGVTVASRVGFVIGDSLYLYYSGFDPRWSRYSVMTTTVAEAIKYAIAQRLKTVNLSPGTDVSKTRWGPRKVQYQTAYEHNHRLRSWLMLRLYLKATATNGGPGRLIQRLAPGRRVWL